MPPRLGYPVPGKTTVYDESQTIDLDNVALGGGVLVKVLVLSIDPYMRRLMQGEDAKEAFVCYAPTLLVMYFTYFALR